MCHSCARLGINTSTIDLDQNQFLVHLDHGNFLVTPTTLEEVTQILVSPVHAASLPLIVYMLMRVVRCIEVDHDLKASNTFCNVHCVGCWTQRNILGLDHTTSFKRPVPQIIHSLMTRQHTVCLNTVIFQQLIANSQCTRAVKYSLPILITHLCRNFSLDEVFLGYDRVFVSPERIVSVIAVCILFGLLQSCLRMFLLRALRGTDEGRELA